MFVKHVDELKHKCSRISEGEDVWGRIGVLKLEKSRSDRSERGGPIQFASIRLAELATARYY